MGNMTTSNVKDNEIIKAIDINDSFNAQITNITRTLQCLLDCEQDFIISKENFVSAHSDGDQDWTINLAPVFAISKETGIPIVETSISQAIASVTPASSFDRYDTVEIRGVYKDTDIDQRSFIDFETNDKKIDTVYTRKELKIECQVLHNNIASISAPKHTDGWIKVAEIFIPANATKIIDCTINNITSDVAELPNREWTNENTSTYNIHYISNLNERFRVEHNEDGTHKDKIIHDSQINFGVGDNQINNSKIPIGEEITLYKKGIPSTETTLATIKSVISYINNFYSKYLANGDYSFQREISIYGDDEQTYADNEKLKIGVNPDNSVYFKIGDKSVLLFNSDGTIQTSENYVPNKDNDIVNKKITDELSTNVNNIEERVENLEITSDKTVYSNNTLSRFSISDINVAVSTDKNISLSEIQVIDSYSCKENDIVLVKNQTDKKQNGLYKVQVFEWIRIGSPKDLRYQLYEVKNGTLNKGKLFYCPIENFKDSENFGTDNISFYEYFGSIKPLANKTVIRDSKGNVKSSNSKDDDDCVTRNEIIAGEIKNEILNYVYPVGSLYWTSKNINPSELFGGEWKQITDTFIFAAGTKKVNESILSSEDGKATIKLEENNIPAHTHAMNHNHEFTPEGTIPAHNHMYTPSAKLPQHEHEFTPEGGITIVENPTFNGKESKTGYMSEKSSFRWSMTGHNWNGMVMDNLSSNIKFDQSGSYRDTIELAPPMSKKNAYTYEINLNHQHSFLPEGTISGGSYKFTGKKSNTEQSGDNINIYFDEQETEEAEVEFKGISSMSGNSTKTYTDYNQNGGQSYDNMPPYLVRYCWQRTR